MATIRQIEIFIQLATHLHFSRAAQALKISQSALSRELNSLEKSLNVRLVDRSNKWNISLTAAGKAYFSQIKHLPHTLERARKSARRASRGETGALQVAVANVIYDHLPLGELFRSMHERFPEIKLMIHDLMGSPMICQAVENGDADIGFIAISNLNSPVNNLRQLELLELEVSFAIPGKHPLAHKKDLVLKDFIGCNFIMPPAQQMPWLRSQFEKIFYEACGAAPHVEQEALGLRATRQLVSAGLGIGMVIKPKVLDERENIVYRDLPLNFKRIIVAVWDENNDSPVLKNMLGLLTEFIKKI